MSLSETPMPDNLHHGRWLLSIGTFILLGAAGCTQQQLYDSTRNWRIQECQSEVEDLEYEICMDRAMISYGEYERLRKEEAQAPQQDPLDMLHWTLRQ